MSTKTHVYGRTRLDVALIVVCLVALAGGLGVFRSYADPVPIDLSETGTSSLSPSFISRSQHQTDSGLYRLKLAQEMTYCFWGTYYQNTTLAVSVISHAETKTYQEQNDGTTTEPQELLCFDSEYAGVVKLQLHGRGILKVSSIVATKQ